MKRSTNSERGRGAVRVSVVRRSFAPSSRGLIRGGGRCPAKRRRIVAPMLVWSNRSSNVVPCAAPRATRGETNARNPRKGGKPANQGNQAVDCD